MANVSINKLAIGETLTDSVYQLKSLNQLNDRYTCLLTDKTGETTAVLYSSHFNKNMLSFVGGAVSINGIVLNGDNMVPEIRIKSMCLAKEGTYNPSDIFNGLDGEHVKLYSGIIKDLMERIPDEDCRALCKACLTDETISKLATKPASLAGHGKYRGGALAAAAVVTKFVAQVGVIYQKFQNGLYKPVFNWSCLITASLLHTYGVLTYFTEQPWHKTPEGLDRGYMSVLQSMIESVMRENGISLSESAFSRILNILGCSLPMKTSVKATCSEGMLFRHCLLLYEELDMMDAGLAEYEPSEGESYFYNSTLRRSVLLRTEEGGVA